MLKAFVAIAVRLTGLYMLIAFGWKVPLLIYSSLSAVTVLPTPVIAHGASSTVLVLSTLIALLFVFIPHRFATWIMFGIPVTGEKTAVSFEELQHVIFSGVGLFYIVKGTVNLHSAAVILLGSDGEMADMHLWYLFSPTLELAAGLLIFLGARGIKRLLKLLRGAAVK